MNDFLKSHIFSLFIFSKYKYIFSKNLSKLMLKEHLMWLQILSESSYLCKNTRACLDPKLKIMARLLLF